MYTCSVAQFSRSTTLSTKNTEVETEIGKGRRTSGGLLAYRIDKSDGKYWLLSAVIYFLPDLSCEVDDASSGATDRLSANGDAYDIFFNTVSLVQ